MRFNFYSPVSLENWDWTVLDRGVGCSEQSHIELCWRLARRGYEVCSYTPTGWDGQREWRGVKWFPLQAANFKDEGQWIVYRSPAILDALPRSCWFVSQDEWYNDLTDERCEKIEKFVALCSAHAKSCLKRSPALSGKIVVSSNGIDCDRVRNIIADPPPRNPRRLMWSSSPDRGLKYLLQTFRRAHEFVPDLELHCFYGFDNIDKLVAAHPRHAFYQKLKDEIMADMDQPGVVWHGRVSPDQLYTEWMKSGIWCYQTNFTETSCATCMEAQALGAIPIVNPIWALAENVQHGIFVRGDAYGDMLVQARFMNEIVKLACQPDLQDRLRPQMMREACVRFNWERVVDQWECWATRTDGKLFHSQYAFQAKHMQGKTLNVGCDNDLCNLKDAGDVVNLDITSVSPIHGERTKAEVIADARKLPLRGQFDTVILGDILEHFLNPHDPVVALRNARAALRNGGRVIVTCPDDPRRSFQHATIPGLYATNISASHEHRVSEDLLLSWVCQAGLRPIRTEEIDYTHFKGYGVVCVP